MKNILKKIGAALWSKKVLVPLIIALSAALGYEMSADDPNEIGRASCRERV